MVVTLSDSSNLLLGVLDRLPPGLLRPPAQAALPAKDALTRDSVRITSAVIADPDEPDADLPAGSVVLGVGARGRDAAELVRAAGAAGAAAVVLRAGVLVGQRSLLTAAARAGVVLLELVPGAQWGQVHAELLAALAPSLLPADDELTGLAETIAALTEGLVTIEDTQARVLAYSVSANDVDELRRLSILGRNGPAAYLALLREWGVYDQLATRDNVVEIAADRKTGIRRRLAVGIFADDQQLGVIWVQQGRHEFPDRARQVLIGAARVAAEELAAPRGRGNARHDDGLAALLSRRARAVPGLGRALAHRPCAVACFEISGESGERAAQQLRNNALAGVLRMYAAGFRASALVTQLAGRCYVLLPDLPVAQAALPTLGSAAAAAGQRVGHPIRAALGRVVPCVADAADSRSTADLVLDSPNREQASWPACFDDHRASLLAEVAIAAVRECPHLFSADLAGLGPRESETLRVYLDAGGDVAATASRLGVHPTTVRYRMRHICQLAGLDSADDRLAAQLQLRAR